MSVLFAINEGEEHPVIPLFLNVLENAARLLIWKAQRTHPTRCVLLFDKEERLYDQAV
jgi:hypothetical protein